MRVRLQFHQYRLIVPIVQEMKSKSIKDFTQFISEYLRQHFNNKFISIVELSTSDRYALNSSDTVQDVVQDNEVLLCLDEQLYLDREIRIYCDRNNAWLHVERKKQPKLKKRRASSAGVDAATGGRRQSVPIVEGGGGGGGRRQSTVSIGATTTVDESSIMMNGASAGAGGGSNYPAKWAEVGYHTRNKLYVLLGVGSYTQVYLFSVDELRRNGFQEKRIGIIEDDTGEWYTMAKFEKERPENFKKRLRLNSSIEEQGSKSPSDNKDATTSSTIDEEGVRGLEEDEEEEDEAIVAIGLHVKAEGDQMANAQEIIIRVTKDGLLTTDASEVVHLFGTKSGKRPRKKKYLLHADDVDETSTTSE